MRFRIPGGECENNRGPIESESLILVDAAGRAIGHMSKTDCHQGRGILHRAFSLLIFNDSGELLLQQRAPAKPLKALKAALRGPRLAGPMAADLPVLYGERTRRSVTGIALTEVKRANP